MSLVDDARQERVTEANTHLRSRALWRKGLNVHSMSPDEWLRFAEDAEYTAQCIGPFDAAYQYYVEQSNNCLEAACVAELLSLPKGSVSSL